MQTNNTELKIYVADLHDYNDGKLVGAWISVADNDDEDSLWAAIRSALSNPEHEWAIHDAEGLSISEHESVTNLIEMQRACSEHGCDKVKAFLGHGLANGTDNLTGQIADSDGGTFESKEAWAQDYIDSAYDLDKMLGNLACYFDHEAFARDAELGGDVTFMQLDGGSIWVVNNG